MQCSLDALKKAVAPHYPHVVEVSEEVLEKWDDDDVAKWIRDLNGLSNEDFLDFGQKSMMWENSGEDGLGLRLEVCFTQVNDAIEFKIRFL